MHVKFKFCVPSDLIMIMGWSLCLVVLCAAFCVIDCHLKSDSEETGQLESSGIKSCRYLKCTKCLNSTDAEDYSEDEPLGYMGGKVLPSDDSLCPLICEQLVQYIEKIDRPLFSGSEHMCDVLFRVAKAANGLCWSPDSCNGPIKLLDLIITAAKKVKSAYTDEKYPYCVEEDFRKTLLAEKLSKASIDRRMGMSVWDATEHEETDTSYVEETAEQTTEYSTSKGTEEPCPDKIEPEITTSSYKQEDDQEKPCPDERDKSYVQTDKIAEEKIYPPFTGSMRGVPGENYPNYSEVPITSFSCADKKYIPGFYADLETGCQIFHVCYKHRRESFLCPVGTIFNQPILACDYWYSSNCSLAPIYYEVNAQEASKQTDPVVEDLINIIEQEQQTTESKVEVSKLPGHLDDILNFLPVKAIVTDFSETKDGEDAKISVPKKSVVKDSSDISSEIFDNILSTATRVISKTRAFIDKIPEPSGVEAEKSVLHEFVKPLVVPSKVKVPMLKKLVSKKAKLAIPIAAKAKLAAAVPVSKVKAKMAVAAAVPVVKVIAAKSAVPIVAKASAAIPLVVKSKLVPVKVMALKAAVPIATKSKAKVLAVPVVAKSKLLAGKIASKAVVPAAKIVASKAALPIAAKAKVAVKSSKLAAKAAVPVVLKGKLAATLPMAKVAAIKASGPALKTKFIAASLPFAKSVVLKSALANKAKIVPAMKTKVVKAASIPIVKGKLLALPLAKSKFAAPVLMKAKIAKAAAISPLTKKVLALGYMKLLKAKKLALLG